MFLIKIDVLNILKISILTMEKVRNWQKGSYSEAVVCYQLRGTVTSEWRYIWKLKSSLFTICRRLKIPLFMLGHIWPLDLKGIFSSFLIETLAIIYFQSKNQSQVRRYSAELDKFNNWWATLRVFDKVWGHNIFRIFGI